MGKLEPKVIYRSERVTLWCGDARDVLPQLGKESIDCVVTDPPYGVNWQSNSRTVQFDKLVNDKPGEGVELLALVADDIWRVTKRTRHIYCFGIPVIHPLLVPKVTLIWDKTRMGSGDLSLPWASEHEVINFHVRQSDKTNAERRGGLVARLRKGSIIRAPRLNANQVKRHPTEKPVALLRQLVESSTQMDELVLDPFAGVGSTLIACLVTGRKSVGVELDPKYCDIAVERIREVERIVEELERSAF